MNLPLSARQTFVQTRRMLASRSYTNDLIPVLAEQFRHHKLLTIDSKYFEAEFARNGDLRLLRRRRLDRENVRRNWKLLEKMPRDIRRPLLRRDSLIPHPNAVYNFYWNFVFALTKRVAPLLADEV